MPVAPAPLSNPSTPSSSKKPRKERGPNWEKTRSSYWSWRNKHNMIVKKPTLIQATTWYPKSWSGNALLIRWCEVLVLLALAMPMHARLSGTSFCRTTRRSSTTPFELDEISTPTTACIQQRKKLKDFLGCSTKTSSMQFTSGLGTDQWCNLHTFVIYSTLLTTTMRRRRLLTTTTTTTGTTMSIHTMTCRLHQRT